jgi:polar amino acid transport system substrate-binding protein
MHNGQSRGQRPLDEVLGLAKMPELQAFSPVRSGKQELSTERRVTMSCLRSFAKLLVAAGAIALTLAAQPAMADRLKDILDRGVLRVGHLVDLPPFGMTDKDQKPIGFDIDLANMMAQDLGVKLQLTAVTGANRLPFLVTDKVDVIIGAFGATPERAKQISFSSAYSSNTLAVYGAANINIKSADELGKYKVAAARGTSQDITLSRMNPKATIIRFEDEATALAAFLSGQTELLAAPNVVFNDAAKKNPDRKMNMKFMIRLATNHIGVRKGEPELLRWVDTFVFYHKMVGDLDTLHRKWLGEKMPDLPSM